MGVDTLTEYDISGDKTKNLSTAYHYWQARNVKILSRASELGSPTNPPWGPGSDKTRGQGSFGPFTGGLPNLTILPS